MPILLHIKIANTSGTLSIIYTLSLNLHDIPVQLILLLTFCRKRNQLERKTSISMGTKGDY